MRAAKATDTPPLSQARTRQGIALALRSAVLIGSLIFAAPLWGAPGQDQNTREIQSLKREVERLKEEVSSLPLSTATDDADSLTLPTLQWRGFGHVQYEANDDGNHFALGDLDLFMTSRIAQKLHFLSELLIEFEENGENELDVERLLLKYDFSNTLAVSLGRGHTGLGYWNQAFHHGVWMQTTVDRPLIYRLEGEGGILPVHYVGLEFSGRFNFGIGDLSYIANVANGRGRTAGAINIAGDDNNSKMLALLITWESEALHGLGLGGSVVFDHIPNNPAAGRLEETQEIIGGLNFYYIDDTLEAIVEWFLIDHQSIEGDRQHNGGYAQLAYSIGDLKPYYRFDFLNVETGDTFFADTSTARQQTVGIRYDVFPYAAVKTEYRYQDADSGLSHTGTIQVSFAF
jgi:hypothetical protein